MTRREGSGNDRSAGNLGVPTARENARETEEGETDRAAGDSGRATGTGLKQQTAREERGGHKGQQQ